MLEVRLPSARNADDVLNLPVVTLTGELILVDGQYAGRAQDPTRELLELEAILRARRTHWLTLQPDVPVPREVMIRADLETPAWILKKMVQAIVRSGFESFSFEVQKV
jgi:hypothetical protein